MNTPLIPHAAWNGTIRTRAYFPPPELCSSRREEALSYETEFEPPYVGCYGSGVQCAIFLGNSLPSTGREFPDEIAHWTLELSDRSAEHRLGSAEYFTASRGGVRRSGSRGRTENEEAHFNAAPKTGGANLPVCGCPVVTNVYRHAGGAAAPPYLRGDVRTVKFQTGLI